MQIFMSHFLNKFFLEQPCNLMSSEENKIRIFVSSLDVRSQPESIALLCMVTSMRMPHSAHR